MKHCRSRNRTELPKPHPLNRLAYQTSAVFIGGETSRKGSKRNLILLNLHNCNTLHRHSGHMKNTIFALLLVLTACGSETASEKSLFSKWTKVGSATTIDISSGSFGTFSMVWGFASGASCTNNVTLTGSEASSTAILTGASYSGGGSGDPGCSSLNGSYTLTKTGNSLRICVGTTTTCEEYN